MRSSEKNKEEKKMNTGVTGIYHEEGADVIRVERGIDYGYSPIPAWGDPEIAVIAAEIIFRLKF